MRMALGWTIIITGALMPAVAIPAFLLKEVTLTERGFSEEKATAWDLDMPELVLFDDLVLIEVIAISSPSKGDQMRDHYLRCHERTGNTRDVHLGPLMKHGAAQRILQQAQQHGVLVSSQL